MPTLVFDCDGVLADTERYGHLRAFNATFEEFGLPRRWDEDEYAELLQVGGGKERMATLFRDRGFVQAANIPEGEKERSDLLHKWHQTKTAHFKRIVADGKLPPRPGIARLIPEALEAGWTVTVASTSAEESVRAVLRNAVGRVVADRVPVFAGDIVTAKKPDPAIYTLAVTTMGADPDDVLVIEDSRNGLLSAVGAGLPCLITVNGYTCGENFDRAILVVSELGDPGRPPIEILANRGTARPGDYVTLDDLRDCIRGGGRPAREQERDREETDRTGEGNLR